MVTLSSKPHSANGSAVRKHCQELLCAAQRLLGVKGWGGNGSTATPRSFAHK